MYSAPTPVPAHTATVPYPYTLLGWGLITEYGLNLLNLPSYAPQEEWQRATQPFDEVHNWVWHGIHQGQEGQTGLEEELTDAFWWKKTQKVSADLAWNMQFQKVTHAIVRSTRLPLVYASSLEEINWEALYKVWDTFWMVTETVGSNNATELKTNKATALAAQETLWFALKDEATRKGVLTATVQSDGSTPFFKPLDKTELIETGWFKRSKIALKKSVGAD